MSCLGEIDIETVSFADIVIVIKNGLRKEDKNFAKSYSISLSEVCFCSPALPWDLGLHNRGEICGNFGDKGVINGSVHLPSPCSLQKLQL